MELFEELIFWIDSNLALSLAPLILTLLIGQKLFFKTLDVGKYYLAIRLFILFFTLLNILYFLLDILFSDELEALIQRSNGPYGIIYGFLLFSSLVLPLSLFIKSLAQNVYYLLFIAIFLKIGWFFEKFVIISTQLHRDYLPENEINYSSILNPFLEPFVKGFIVGLILIMVGMFRKKWLHK